MRFTLKQLMTMFLALFVVNIVSVSHVSAMPMGGHHLDHPSEVSSCAVVCLSSPKNINENIDAESEENDYLPPGGASLLQREGVDILLYYSQRAGYVNYEPSGSMLYRLCCVIRR